MLQQLTVSLHLTLAVVWSEGQWLVMASQVLTASRPLASAKGCNKKD